MPPRVSLRASGCHSKHYPRAGRFHDIAASARLKETRPRLHERPPLFERVAPPVGPLRHVADGVGERGLGDLAREMGFVSAQSRKAERKP